jgi:hypothetical protein
MNAVRFGQTPSKEALFRFGVTAAACVAAMIAGPFIVSYDNPLTATLVIAALTVFLVSIINPKAGQDFANSGGYFPLTLIAGILFPKPQDVKQSFKFCLIVCIPVALYGVRQQVFGLSNFEIDYLGAGHIIRKL